MGGESEERKTESRGERNRGRDRVKGEREREDSGRREERSEGRDRRGRDREEGDIVRGERLRVRGGERRGR